MDKESSDACENVPRLDVEEKPKSVYEQYKQHEIERMAQEYMKRNRKLTKNRALGIAKREFNRRMMQSQLAAYQTAASKEKPIHGFIPGKYYGGFAPWEDG